jgi:hypothetical protein
MLASHRRRLFVESESMVHIRHASHKKNTAGLRRLGLRVLLLIGIFRLRRK